MQLRTAIVTGAASGLGREFCLELARRGGWRVVAVDLDRGAAEATIEEAKSHGLAGGEVASFDVTDLSAWTALRERLQQERPRLDLLVNNAGVCMAAEVGDGDAEVWRRVWEVNFLGLFHGCHVMTPWLKASAQPRELDSAASRPAIVNVASIAAIVAAPAMGAYNASKAAVVALSETMYGELRPHGVDVTVVAPGFFRSQLLARGDFATRELRLRGEKFVRQSQVSAAEVARAALDAAYRGELYVVLGRRARWLWRLKRLAPRTLTRLIAGKYASAAAEKPADG
jgi:NAD(P)-dependent dehydrogenase (short-subunit alcohol dehydrogenase family)